MVLAHGVGTRSDLPVPIWLAAAGAALALVISFVVLGALWRRPRFTGTTGRPLPAGVQAVLDAPALRIVLRAVTLAAVVFVCAVGFTGPPSTSQNIAPWVLYITFWVGLVPASLLLGPVWRVLNPLRLLHAVLARVLRLDPQNGPLPLPDAVGYWPAAVSLAAFTWVELVLPGRADPVPVATVVVLYGGVHLVAALAFGRRWFDRGDGFEAYSTLLGSIAPLGRRDDGRLVLRGPFDGLSRVVPAPGLVAVVVVLVGSTAYDGFSRTQWWVSTVPAGAVNATFGLLGTILLISVVYVLGTWRLVGSGKVSDGSSAKPSAFAHTLVPIAAGYAIAHYFSLLLFDGQQVSILASDPFGTGADLFGTGDRVIDYTLIGTTAIALVQIGAIVAGHLVAAVSAHERAVALFPERDALRVQYPLLTAMVALTVGAVGLIFAA